MGLRSAWRRRQKRLKFERIARACRAMQPRKGYKRLLIEERKAPRDARIPWQLGNVCVDLQPRPTETMHGVVCGTSRLGKALALDTPVPTPDGWTTMGALQVGDYVFDESGNPTRVVNAWPVLENRPCFEVTFSDGTTIVADAEHQWLTSSASARSNGVPGRVVTTREMSETVEVNWGGRRRNHAVAVAKALQLPRAALPLDPYVLGAWLGDGTSEGATITIGDTQVVDELRASGCVVRKLCPRLRYALGDGNGKGYAKGKLDFAAAEDIRASATTSDVEATRRGVSPSLIRQVRRHQIWKEAPPTTVSGDLRRLGVLNNKHIPQVYLRASFEQRLALLQGLMDTDGWCSEQGYSEFCNTSARLAHNVFELVNSLGIRAKLLMKPCHGRTTGTSIAWSVGFVTSLPVFRVHRKRVRQSAKPSGRTGFRHIVSVKPCASVPVRCIAVEARSHLFLVSKSFIATHNSTAVLPLFELDLGVLVIALDNTWPIRQWIETHPNTVQWTNEPGSIGWNMLTGDPLLVAEALTAGWPGSVGDTGDYRRTARMRMVQRLMVADHQREPRTLDMLIQAMYTPSQPRDSRADMACAQWGRKLQQMDMSLNGSLGFGFDLLTAMQQRKKVLMRLNRYLHHEDAPTLGGMLLVHARRVAQECDVPFILIVEEAGQLDEHQGQIIPLAQAAADRQVPTVIITQNVGKLKTEITNNVSVWVSFANEAKDELTAAAHHLRLKNIEQLMRESFPGEAERQGRGWAMVRAPGVDTHLVQIEPQIVVPDGLPDIPVIRPVTWEDRFRLSAAKPVLALPEHAESAVYYEEVFPWWVSAPQEGNPRDLERWYGNMVRTGRPTPLWSRDRGVWWDERGCLEWKGPYSKHRGELLIGRPRSTKGRQSVTVYIETALAAGREVEPTWDHNCGNPICCEPEHGQGTSIKVNNQNKSDRDKFLRKAWMDRYGQIPQWWLDLGRPRIIEAA